MAYPTDDLETAPEIPIKTSRDAEGEHSLGLIVLYAVDDADHIRRAPGPSGPESWGAGYRKAVTKECDSRPCGSVRG